MFRVVPIPIATCLIDELLHGRNPLDSAIVVISLACALSVVLSARVSAGFGEAICLRKLYTLRIAAAVTAYLLLLSTLIGLHHFLAGFDGRFRLTERAVTVGLVLAAGCALVVFGALSRPRAMAFAARVSQYVRCHGTISVLGLDELYVPAAHRAPAVATSVSCAAATFGMAVVAKLPVFGLLYGALELFLITQFLYSLMSLAYESWQISRCLRGVDPRVAITVS